MTIYFYTETTSVNSFAKATPLRARTLRSAKAEASRRQTFVGTVLKIGTQASLGNNDLLIDEIAVKTADGKWANVELR